MRTYLGLFEGIGVFALAAYRAGFLPTQFVEIDPYRQEILRKNFGDVPCHGDIKTFKPKGQYDLVCGGFPCQDISNSNQKGKGLQGERSCLWGEMLRVIAAAKPKFVVVENVPPTGNGDKYWVNFAKPDLERLGYAVKRLNLFASHFGGCHHRLRTFLVAYPNENRFIVPEIVPHGAQNRARSKVFTKEIADDNSEISWLLPNGEILRGADGPTAWMDRYFQSDKPTLQDRRRIAACGDSIYLPCAEYAIKFCTAHA